MHPSRLFYLIIGWLSVVLGVIGIILPVLPTTPFLLVAVWAFSKSSPELAAKIRGHAVFGPMVRAWQDHGVIPARGKAMAVVMMTAAGVYLLGFSHAPLWLGLALCAAMVAVAVYVVTRPGTPPVPPA